MQTEMLMPLHPPARPGRHAAPQRPPRRLLAVLVPVLVLLVGIGATTTALLLPGVAASRIDAALEQMRRWPSVAVDGHLTGAGEPVRVLATITADGAARGVASRSPGARAEIAVGPGRTLLRGNAHWWRAGHAELAALLADRWISDPHDGAVDQIASGRLAPAALADALAGLRDPEGRTEADVVDDGVRGTAFARGGVRLVVGDDGRPLALAARIGAPRGTAITFRAGDDPAAGQPEPDHGWTATIRVTRAGATDDDAARRAAGDALAQAAEQSPVGRVPSLDEIGRSGRAGRVSIDVLPNPDGCPPVGCTMRYRLRNAGETTVVGLFTVRVDGADLVAARTVALPPGTVSEQSAWIPGRLLTAHPKRRMKIEASFTTNGKSTPMPPLGAVEAPQGYLAGGHECPCGEV
jgi:hypothetical protein